MRNTEICNGSRKECWKLCFIPLRFNNKWTWERMPITVALHNLMMLYHKLTFHWHTSWTNAYAMYTQSKPGFIGKPWVLYIIISWALGQTVLPTQANLSQVTKSKLASVDGQTVSRSRVSSQKNSLIIITKQLHFWLELAWVGWGGHTWLELGKNLSLMKFKATWSNLRQLKSIGWPNDTQLHWSCELGLSWLELGGPFPRGFMEHFSM